MLPTSLGEGGPKLTADLSAYAPYSRSDDILLDKSGSPSPI
jgi:hypothetical protein